MTLPRPPSKWCTRWRITSRSPGSKAYRDLAGFDFSHSEVNETLVRQFHRCQFLANANNVVLMGGRGTSKPHIATGGDRSSIGQGLAIGEPP